MAVQYYCHVPPSVSRDQCTALSLEGDLVTNNLDLYLTNIRFGIILTQFYVNFSRQEHHIDFYRYRSTPEILRFQPMPPFIFSFTVPLIMFIYIIRFIYLCKYKLRVKTQNNNSPELNKILSFGNWRCIAFAFCHNLKLSISLQPVGVNL